MIFLCYFFGIFFSGFVLLIEKKNKKLRYFALQAFLFHAFIIITFVPSMWVGTYIMLNLSKTTGIIILGIGSLFQVIMLVFWIIALAKTLMGKTPNIPFINRMIKNVY